MAFPTTGLLDDFDRADETPVNSDWSGPVFTGENTLSIASNQLRRTSGGVVTGNMWWQTSQYGADCEVYARLPQLGGDSEVLFLMARLAGMDGSPTGYALRLQSTAGQRTMLLRRLNGDGTATDLGSTTNVTITADDSVGLEIVGPTITAYQKISGTWTQITQQTDATYSSAGFLGLLVQGITWRADDFSGGTVVPAAATSSLASQYLDYDYSR